MAPGPACCVPVSNPLVQKKPTLYPADPAPESLQPVQVKIRDEDVETNTDEYGLLFGVLSIVSFL